MDQNVIITASQQWATRPDDQRFLSLPDLLAHCDAVRNASTARVISSREIELEAVGNNDLVATIDGYQFAPSHWAFGQLASLAGAPAGYLRQLPAPLAQDCVNFGLQVERQVEQIGALTYRNGDSTLRAVTGPKYGRIWNADIVRGMIDNFGDGINGHFRVPGEFGERVEVDKQNTTIYGSDRDIFVFLADEENRVEIPGAGRNGAPELLARGFFVSNSEVGSGVFNVATFFFRFACSNRTVWGPAEYREIKIRHTSGAPERFVRELAPALESYAKSSTVNLVEAVKVAQASRIAAGVDPSKRDEAVTEFLAKRFNARRAQQLKTVHQLEEGRPIETLYDASVAVTALARSIPNQDERVIVEREGGQLLSLATD